MVRESKTAGSTLDSRGFNYLPCLYTCAPLTADSASINSFFSSVSGGQCCLSTDVLKMGVSLMASAFFFPLLVWGGFVFLPFDAPLLDGAPLRLVYTLRCSVFAATPIVLGESHTTEKEMQNLTCLTCVRLTCSLGWLVLGISRLRSGVLRPLFDDEIKEAELQEVTVHQRFISDSASLFLIYFLQLVVMAMYLSQEQLKLVPLLTILFAFGR